jgi:hypothetical protein
MQPPSDTLIPAPAEREQPRSAAASAWLRLATAAMSERWLLWIAFAGMFTVYAQTIFFDFVYDDVILILLNPWMHGWKHVHTIFTSTFWGFMTYQAAGGTTFYRPLTMMWLFLINQAGHGAPGFFHLGVVLMHLVVMLEIYLLGRKLTGDAVTGALAALLFGIHPTHIESVAWISGISDVMCAAFFLAALLGYLHWADGDGMRWLLWSLLCLESALLSKEAAALLVLLILLDRLRQFYKLDWVSRCVHAVYVTLPYIVLTGLHFAWQSYVISQRSLHADAPGIEPSAALSPYVLWWYLKKQVVPVPVSAHYTTLSEGGLSTAQIILTSLACLAFLAVAWWFARRSRTGQLLVALFGFTLLPVVVGVQTLQLHDRYLYLPGIAIALGAAMLLRETPLLCASPERQFVLVLAITAILVPLGCRETSYWASDVKLFEHSLKVEPHTVLNLEVLADSYIALDDGVHAEQVMREAVAEFPGRSRQWTRLADFCLRKGSLDEAETYARKAVSLTPVSKSLPTAFGVLSAVALKKGNLSEAELWAKRAVVADGSSSVAHRNLAAVYAAQGQSAQVSVESQIAAKIEADNQPRDR